MRFESDVPWNINGFDSCLHSRLYADTKHRLMIKQRKWQKRLNWDTHVSTIQEVDSVVGYCKTHISHNFAGFFQTNTSSLSSVTTRTYILPVCMDSQCISYTQTEALNFKKSSADLPNISQIFRVAFEHRSGC